MSVSVIRIYALATIPYIKYTVPYGRENSDGSFHTLNKNKMDGADNRGRDRAHGHGALGGRV